MKYSNTRNKARFQRSLGIFLRVHLPRLFLITLIFILGYFINIFINDTSKIKVTKIEVTGIEKYVNANDFSNISNSLLLEKNIFTLNISLVEKNLSDLFQGARSIKVTKKLPNTIHIAIKERYPVAIVTDATKDRFLIDEDGYVLGSVNDSYFDLPNVQYSGKLLVGKFLDKNLVPVTLEILNSAKKESLEVSTVSFSDKSAEFYVKGGTYVLMSTDKSVGESLKIVSTLLKNTDTSSKTLSKIDLRYDKVIVSY